MCLAGANACLPEDVVVIHGYEEFFRAVRVSSHEEHAAMLRWARAPFDPTDFEISSVNRVIRMRLFNDG